MSFETTHITESYRDHGEDRVAVFHNGDRTVIVVADGAGGAGGGDQAADFVICEIEREFSATETADKWTELLNQVDCRIGTGESTAVVVDLKPGQICGASVGDSQAWIIANGEIHSLTFNQVRKPLLGSREARPVGFTAEALSGVLLVATDGFCKYVKPDKLATTIAREEFFSIPRVCLEMVRLPSGDLWDDVGIVACRVRPRHRARKRYTI